MAVRVTPSGNVVTQVNDDASITIDPFDETASVGVREGPVRAGVGVNSGGNVGANLGVGTNVGDDTQISGGIGFGSGGPSAGVGVNQQVGDNVNIGVGVGVGAGGIGVTPTVTVTPRDSSAGRAGSQVGATAGGIVGGYFAGPVGAAAGSAVGSTVGGIKWDILFGSSAKSDEHKQRDSLRNAFKDFGLWGQDYTLELPDGSVANFNQEGGSGVHAWRDRSRTIKKEGGRDLFAYETDYTNDLDYLSGMAGMALSRLLTGTTGKPVDQLGSLIGNQALGSVGHGADLNPESFNTVMGNLRALYARGNVSSKEDMLAMANTMFSQGRITDLDYAAIEQISGILFDNDYTGAQALMQGRWSGIEAAAQSGSGGQTRRPGSVHSPVISPQEARALVAEAIGGRGGSIQSPTSSSSRTAARVAEIAGIGTAAAGAVRTIDRATGGAIADAARDFGQYVGILGPEETDYGGTVAEDIDVEIPDDVAELDFDVQEVESDYTL